MINLLPHDKKILIENEYKHRRIAVGLGLLLSVVVISCIMLMPSYILLLYRSKVSEQLSQVDPSQKDTNDRKALTDALKSDNLILNALKPNPPSVLPTSIIQILMKDKTSDNSVTNINFSNDPLPFKMTVHGTAKNRQSLLGFVDALKHEPGIQTVDIPISNFTQDTSIDFSFVVTGEPIN